MLSVRFIFILGLIALLAVGCDSTDAPAEPVTVRLMTHNSFDMSSELLEQFEEEAGFEVEVFKAGDGGEALTRAILSRDAPLADVFFGVDNTFLSRALENDIFITYDSPVLAEIPDELKLDPSNRALPVDYGDVCLNYDTMWFSQRGLDPPASLADLADPAYADLTIVQNPATSTPGLAFLLATIETFGEDGYLDYWRSLVDNGVVVTDGWEQAYYTYFSAASDGELPVVVSYASSPAAEVYFAEQPPVEAPTASVTTPGSCFRQIEFVGILEGTQHEAEAQRLVDFMLSPEFQNDIPLRMFVYPANRQAQLPEVFVLHADSAVEPVQMDPDRIGESRERWIQAWTEVVLR
ncbi:MAG: thiamine ABC transporter substrate-binding protein [Chloroflexota bacterium]